MCAKIRRGKAEEQKQTETRAQTEALFTWCEKENMLGAPVQPVFDANPELVPEASAFKKLSDEEEIALRKAEQAALLAARNKEAASTSSASRATSGLDAANGNSDDSSSTTARGDGGGDVTQRLQARMGSFSSMKGGFGSASEQQHMGEASKQDFMKMLETTLGGSGSTGSGAKFSGSGNRKPPAVRDKSGVGLRKSSTGRDFKGSNVRDVAGSAGVGARTAEGGPGAEASSPVPPPSPKLASVVLKKGMSSKLRALLGSSSKQASKLSTLIVDETAQPPKDAKPAGASAAASPSRAKDKTAPVVTFEASTTSTASTKGSGGSKGGPQPPSQGLSSLMAAASDDAMLQALRERSLRDSSALGSRSFHGQSPTTSGGGGGHNYQQQHPALRRMLSRASVGGNSSHASSHGSGLTRNLSVASVPTSSLHHSSHGSHESHGGGGGGGGPPPRAGAGLLGGRERTFSRTSSVASMQGFGRTRTSSGNNNSSNGSSSGSSSFGASLRASFSSRKASVSGDAFTVEGAPPSRPAKSDETKSIRESISHV